MVVIRCTACRTLHNITQLTKRLQQVNPPGHLKDEHLHPGAPLESLGPIKDYNFGAPTRQPTEGKCVGVKIF